MAGVQFRRQDNLQKPPRFRCSIVCEFISPSGDAFLSPALSISAPILLDTLGACPVVCGAGAVRRFGPWAFAPPHAEEPCAYPG